MSDAIDRDEDDETYPYVMNGPIAPALEGTDSGWTKDETWQMGAESSGACGDYAVGPYYEAHYSKQVGDLWMLVEEVYFVEPRKKEEPDGTWTKHYDVIGSYTFTLCTDRDDPGGTEVNSDTRHDDDLHALFIYDYEEARAMAEKLALSDQRHTLLWNGER